MKGDGMRVPRSRRTAEGGGALIVSGVYTYAVDVSYG